MREASTLLDLNITRTFSPESTHVKRISPPDGVTNQGDPVKAIDPCGDTLPVCAWY